MTSRPRMRGSVAELTRSPSGFCIADMDERRVARWPFTRQVWEAAAGCGNRGDAAGALSVAPTWRPSFPLPPPCGVATTRAPPPRRRNNRERGQQPKQRVDAPPQVYIERASSSTSCSSTTVVAKDAGRAVLSGEQQAQQLEHQEQAIVDGEVALDAAVPKAEAGSASLPPLARAAAVLTAADVQTLVPPSAHAAVEVPNAAPPSVDFGGDSPLAAVLLQRAASYTEATTVAGATFVLPVLRRPAASTCFRKRWF